MGNLFSSWYCIKFSLEELALLIARLSSNMYLYSIWHKTDTSLSVIVLMETTNTTAYGMLLKGKNDGA